MRLAGSGGVEGRVMVPWRVVERVRRIGEVWLGAGVNAVEGATPGKGFFGEGVATRGFFGDGVGVEVELAASLAAVVFSVVDTRRETGLRSKTLRARFAIVVVAVFLGRGRRPLREGGILTMAPPRASRFTLFPALRPRVADFAGFCSICGSCPDSESSDSESSDS